MNKATIKIDLSECPSCVSFNIRKAMRAVSQHYDKVLAPAGLRATQFTILTALIELDSITITELADTLVMERTTLTRNLKLLIKADYLKIIPDMHDRRSRQVELTASGRKIQKTALPYWQQAQDQMINFMGKANSKQFIHDLRRAATCQEQM